MSKKILPTTEKGFYLFVKNYKPIIVFVCLCDFVPKLYFIVNHTMHLIQVQILMLPLLLNFVFYSTRNRLKYF